MLRTRVISAIVLVLILGTGLYVGGLLWWVLLLFISLVGYREYCTAIFSGEDPGDMGTVTDKKVRNPAVPEVMGYILAILYYVLIMVKPYGVYMLYAMTGSVILFMCIFVLLYPRYNSAVIMQFYFGLLYIPFMISFLYMLRIRDKGLIEVVFVVISSWICDTFAYFTGRLLGRHKLAPVLSPKKSVEGAVGGAVFSGIFGGLLAFIIHDSIPIFALVTFIGAIISQFGDLFASGIKRDKGIKDYGHLIPGHGGILDRFDSVIITAPVIYILCNTLL